MSDTSLNKYLAQGDDAAEAAFTPVPVTGTTPEQAVLFVNDQTPASPAIKWWNGAAFVTVSGGGGGGGAANATINGRLTTESGVPVSTGDRTAQSTIYFTPYNGNQIGLYTGAAWTVVSFSELSLSLSGLTSGKNYDVFVDYNSGTPQLVLSAAWTDDSTRADALALQDGIYVKSGTATYRYVGTFYTTSTTTTEDSEANRYVWNLYNRVRRAMAAPLETANTWTYTSTTWRQANANTANQLNYTVGLLIDAVDVALNVICSSTSPSITAIISIGVNSTTAPSAARPFRAQQGLSAISASYAGYPGLGRNFLAWLEASNGSTATFAGDNNNPTLWQSTMAGSVWN